MAMTAKKAKKKKAAAGSPDSVIKITIEVTGDQAEVTRLKYDGSNPGDPLPPIALLPMSIIIVPDDHGGGGYCSIINGVRVCP